MVPHKSRLAWAGAKYPKRERGGIELVSLEKGSNEYNY